MSRDSDLVAANDKPRLGRHKKTNSDTINLNKIALQAAGDNAFLRLDCPTAIDKQSL